MGDIPDLVLDLVKPHTAERVEKQLKQKEQHDNKVKERSSMIKKMCSFKTILEVTNGYLV